MASTRSTNEKGDGFYRELNEEINCEPEDVNDSVMLGEDNVLESCSKQKTAHKAKAVSTSINSHEVPSEELFAALALDGSTIYAGQWLIDSGTSSHMTYQRNVLADYHELEQPEKVGLGMVELLMLLVLERYTFSQYINKLIEKEMVTGMKVPKSEYLSFCEGCINGEICRSPFKPVGALCSQRKLELVHSDVCGPMSVESFGGHKYFVTFIDDYSHCCAVYFLKQKAEIFQKFKALEAGAINSAGNSIGTLKSENGGEYLSTEFANLKSKGIRHELSVPNTTTKRGIRKNELYLDGVWTIDDVTCWTTKQLLG
ncbi:PREDICTED: uncharacterized protein LOC105314013 [Amphimedon queenslandica]|uniref:Integrase catalytic domain-containing protein n=2 Tax=Amphimedon queenslandica TaxID=400682 RepID=A0AAN0IPM0_AMPQE|nr:PREDICTED: uncharacterized protein LOC105314013 [Amphimedon queenslandica]|eukprot:XP_011406211.1 PREDICTED: uncharacterized protein LOC105314013 [Amphimedon queenslandica]